MRALSVKQPHAERIASGKKKTEFRSWSVNFRGPLLIVASKSPDRDACEEHGIDPKRLLHGVSICVVDLVGVDGDEGDYEWKMRKPRRVLPVAIRGYAAIYNVPDKLITFV